MVRKNKAEKKNKKKCSPPEIPSNHNNDRSQIILDNLTKNILSSDEFDSLNKEEAQGIVEAIVFDHSEGCLLPDDECFNGSSRTMNTTDDMNSMARSLCDYLPGMNFKEAQSIIRNSFNMTEKEEDYDHDDATESSDHLSCENDFVDEDDEDEKSSDDEYIQDGECELCERYMKLTRHHLIPKSTWSKVKSRLLKDPSHFLSDVMDDIGVDAKNNSIKLFLGGYTASICRPCHNMIHRVFSNIELAEEYNTVEKLLGDDQVVKFCKWANKQRAGKHKKNLKFTKNR